MGIPLPLNTFLVGLEQASFLAPKFGTFSFDILANQSGSYKLFAIYHFVNLWQAIVNICIHDYVG